MTRFVERERAERLQREALERDKIRQDPGAFILGLLERETPLSTGQIEDRFTSMGLRGVNVSGHLKALEKEKKIYSVAKAKFEMWYSGPRPGRG